jgi:prophage DNA circulation protein
LIAAFEPVLIDVADNGDAMTYQALNALRATVVHDLTERARPLPRVLQLSFPIPLPALAMSNRLYSKGDRSDELVIENRVVHPAFMPLDIIALSA